MAADPGQAPPEVQLPAAWIGVEQQPVLAANQFLSQVVASDEVVITVGHFTPPVILGTPEQQAQQMKNVSFVQVRPIGRFGLTPARLRELITVLETTLVQVERVAGLERGKRKQP